MTREEAAMQYFAWQIVDGVKASKNDETSQKKVLELVKEMMENAALGQMADDEDTEEKETTKPLF